MKVTTTRVNSSLTLPEVEKRLAHLSRNSENEFTLDGVLTYHFTVRVNFGRSEGPSSGFIGIPTKLILESQRKKLVLRCISDVTKPFLISVILGGIGTIPALISQSWIASVFFFIAFFTFIFVSFISQISKRTEQYLKSLDLE